ncbi:MAG: hypothetical protein JNIBNLAF_01133 [Nitrosomonas europaea]|nr:hypothetical protein [Nitrosomonas europaea]
MMPVVSEDGCERFGLGGTVLADYAHANKNKRDFVSRFLLSLSSICTITELIHADL